MEHMLEPGAFVRRHVSPGDLDQSFGVGGRATFPSFGFGHPAGDDKYWVVTERQTPPARVEVRRLLQNGAADPEFPLDGTIVDLYPYPDAVSFGIRGVRIQSSGKIIVSGSISRADGRR